MPGWRRTLHEGIVFFSLAFRPGSRRARVLYDVAAASNQFTEHSLYLNLGYWKHDPKNLDAACQAMAELLAEAAGMVRQDHVLDVGFGFGDQDLYWMARHQPASITGLNITPNQVSLARERAVRHGQGQMQFAIGSATELPFQDCSFDKVMALECSHHFVTRDDFFHEAFRVLRPGGRLACAEVLALEEPGNRTTWRDRLATYERHFFGAWPRDNWYSREVYRRKLEKSGFSRVRIDSIREHVYPQLLRYLSTRLEEPDLKVRVNQIHRRRWLRNVRSASYRRRTLRTFDYVIAAADKAAQVGG